MERLVGCRNFSIPYIITLSVTKEMNDTVKPQVYLSGVSRCELLGMELCQHNDSNDRALPCVRA